MQYLSFCDWLISFSMVSSRSSMRLHMTVFPSFSWMNNVPLYMYTIFPLYIHLSMDTYCFHILAMINNAAVNIGVLPVWDPDLSSLEYIPRNGMTASYGSSIFKFLRNFHTVFQSDYTILHSQQKGTNLPISPHPHQHLLSLVSFCFVDNSHPNRYKVISHCDFDLHFLMIGNVKHLFRYLLPICTSSLEKHLFKFFAHFLIKLSGFFCYWVVWVLYIFWKLTS